MEGEGVLCVCGGLFVYLWEGNRCGGEEAARYRARVMR